MEKQNSKERKTGIDCLRIVAMIMILFIHFYGREALQPEFNLGDGNYYAITILKGMCCVAVNCFLLITGYFTINKSIKFTKTLKIWGTTLFYTLSFFLVFIFVRHGQVTKTEVLQSFFPIITESYWFITAYIGIGFLSPIICITIPKLTKKQYKYFLIVLIILLVVIGQVYPYTGVFNSITGLNFATMLLMYFIGGYIKLHLNIKKENSNKYLLGYIIMSLIIFLNAFVMDILGACFGGIFKLWARKEFAYNSIFVVASSVLLFMYFASIEIKGKFAKKIIAIIQPLIFAVYIMHEDIFVRLKTLGALKYQNSVWFIPDLFLKILALFLVCCFIEYIRQFIGRKFAKLELFKKIISKIQKLDEIQEKTLSEQCDKQQYN